MAKKKNPDSRKKYFWRDIYAGSIPGVFSMLKAAHAVAGSTNLQLLDQETMSQETLINALFVWAGMMAEQPRAAAIMEQTLRPAFERLNQLVKEDMEKQKKPPETGGEKGGTGETASFEDPPPDRKTRRKKA